LSAEAEHDRLPAFQALQHGRLEKLLGAGLDLLGCDAPGQQAADLVEREQRGTILDQTLEEAVALCHRRGHHDEQAAG
jgi:hypothetical protein